MLRATQIYRRILEWAQTHRISVYVVAFLLIAVAISLALVVAGSSIGSLATGLIVTALIIGYILILLWGRWAWVVTPNNNHLRAHSSIVRARLDAGPNDEPKESRKAAESLLDKVDNKFEFEDGFLTKWSFAFTGEQLAAWRMLHEASQLAIDCYDPDTVAEIALVQLDKLSETPSKTTALEEQIRDALKQSLTESATDGPLQKQRLRRLLKEARTIIHKDEDEGFQTLADAQNKALWLVIVAAFLVIGLSINSPVVAPLLLAGAAGGLLARLRTVVKRRPLPFDYGVSWSVLFLAPLVGSLTGWAGTLLFTLLDKANVLGESFKVDVSNPDDATIIIALVFGFSAVLFDTFVQNLEEGVGLKRLARTPQGNIRSDVGAGAD